MVVVGSLCWDRLVLYWLYWLVMLHFPVHGWAVAWLHLLWGLLGLVGWGGAICGYCTGLAGLGRVRTGQWYLTCSPRLGQWSAVWGDFTGFCLGAGWRSSWVRLKLYFIWGAGLSDGEFLLLLGQHLQAEEEHVHQLSEVQLLNTNLWKLPNM